MSVERGEIQWKIPKPRGWSPEQYIASFESSGDLRRVEVGLWIMKRGLSDVVPFLEDRAERSELPGADMSEEYFHDELLIGDLWPMLTALSAVTLRRSIRHPVAGNRVIMSVEERRQRSEQVARNGYSSAWSNIIRIRPGEQRLQQRFEGLLEVVGAATYHLTYAMRPVDSSGPVVPKTTQPPRDYV